MEEVLKTLEAVPIEGILRDANLMHSHVRYNIKSNDDKTFTLKEKIAPYRNEDRDKDLLTTDFQTFTTTGITIVISVASLKGWKLKRGDAKGDFLKTGKAERKVYGIRPTESKMRSPHRWPLLVATYAFVNYGAKWQKQTDELLFKSGLVQPKHIPELFCKFQYYKLI